MPRSFCLICFGSFFEDLAPPPGAEKLAHLAKILSPDDSKKVFRATRKKPAILFERGASLDACKVADAALTEAGFLAQIHLLDGNGKPEIFVEQRVRQRRSPMMADKNEDSPEARKKRGRRKSDGV